MKKLLLLLPLTMAAVTVTPGDWALYKGSSILSRWSTETACVQEATRLNITQAYTCRTSTAVSVTKASSSSSSSASSSSSGSASSSSSSSVVSAWNHCANQGETCVLTGSGLRTIRYGVDSRWSTIAREASYGDITCSAAYFADPAPGVTKTCQVQSSASSSSSSSQSSSVSSSIGVATLTWTRPTKNTDDSPIDPITGFRIQYGSVGSNLDKSITVGNVTSYMIPLPSGTWYFTVRTITKEEGPQSNVVSATL